MESSETACLVCSLRFLNLTSKDYTGLYAQKNKDPRSGREPDGTAIFWKAKKFRLAGQLELKRKEWNQVFWSGTVSHFSR